MTVSTIDVIVFQCDQCRTTARADKSELPPLWIFVEGLGKTAHFCSPDHLARWLGETIEVEIGLKQLGAGDATLTLEEVVDIRGRSKEYILGCASCGAKRGEAHKMGCALHR